MSTDAQVVLAAEDRRCRAVQDGDLHVLDDLCADALSYARSGGTRDPESEYLARIGSGYYVYLRIGAGAPAAPGVLHLAQR